MHDHDVFTSQIPKTKHGALYHAFLVAIGTSALVLCLLSFRTSGTAEVTSTSHVCTTTDLLSEANLGTDYRQFDIPALVSAGGFQQNLFGTTTVCSYQRYLGPALVEKDFLNYQFDQQGKLSKKIVSWQTELDQMAMTDLVSRNKIVALARTLTNADAITAQLYIISPNSDIFPRRPYPYAAWVTSVTIDSHTTISVFDAHAGNFVGQALPPPSQGFAFSGPSRLSPCSYPWTSLYQNASAWFSTWGYTTTALEFPLTSVERSVIEDPSTSLFYEIAHGGSTSWQNSCSGVANESMTTAHDIEEWMASREKMPFAFIASCDGLCATGDNTMSYELRKGSDEKTVTVGYCGMSVGTCLTSCWGQSLAWQDAFFNYINQGYTVGAAYDAALADHPNCNTCMQLAGDPDLIIAHAADVGISISDRPDPSIVGGKLAYILKLTNAGPGDAENVMATLTLPPTVQYQTYTTTSTTRCLLVNRNTLTCTVSKLTNTSPLTLSIQVKPLQAGTLTTSGTITASTTDQYQDNNTDQEQTTIYKTSIVPIP
jgi:uncharacterized repeat protein (TIGR01451 family)